MPQRYEKNRRGKPCGGRNLRKRRADTSRHPIATCLPSADFPLSGKAARLLSCRNQLIVSRFNSFAYGQPQGHERRSAGNDQRFRRQHAPRGGAHRTGRLAEDPPVGKGQARR
ncbi:hypothetical protein [Phocaeicola vulgatus]|uniref:hypothetical protein n=1 Tax=Phocaeicola vulgatus TaxID=821 RepID=UPI00216B251A|nr:hypothetical protein [Phocaeicola vulgatus]